MPPAMFPGAGLLSSMLRPIILALSYISESREMTLSAVCLLRACRVSTPSPPYQPTVSPSRETPPFLTIISEATPIAGFEAAAVVQSEAPHLTPRQMSETPASTRSWPSSSRLMSSTRASRAA